jgi:protein-S-isoprenylcysteine O-methyltransferase Ste14
MNLRALVGSGDRIMLLTLPFLAFGLTLNVVWPAVFRVGGPPTALRLVSIIMLIPGVIVWAWSAVLILTRVPRHELITTGPYAIVKHPLYTGVAFLVLPWAGFLIDSWLGVPIGIVLYVGSRLFSPEEERKLAVAFGRAWDAYCTSVRIPWI